MESRLVLVLAILLCGGGALIATGQDVREDIQRLLQVAEGIDENVEDMEDEIEDVGDEIEDMEDEIEDFGEEIEDIKMSVETVMAEMESHREELKAFKSELQSHGKEVKNEFSQLREEVCGTEIITEELAVLQNSTLHSLQELKQQLIDLRRELVLPRSCSEIDPSSPSGYYTLNWNRVSVYCDMDRQSCGCGTPKGWMRVAHIDMTDSNQQCPEGFRLRSGTSPRMCEIARSSEGCTSIIFPTHSVQYSRICGRVKAYQYGSTDAFGPYSKHRSRTIDDQYVDGVSITHGQNPRKHIWTFAAARQETSSGVSACPCIKTSSRFTGVVPPFIGNDYFCDTGSSSNSQRTLYYDPLWDGAGCTNSNTCCQFNSPPWFCKDLPQPTTDNIEVRVCRDQERSDEDIPFELIDLYTQ